MGGGSWDRLHPHTGDSKARPCLEGGQVAARLKERAGLGAPTAPAVADTPWPPTGLLALCYRCAQLLPQAGSVVGSLLQPLGSPGPCGSGIESPSARKQRPEAAAVRGAGGREGERATQKPTPHLRGPSLLLLQPAGDHPHPQLPVTPGRRPWSGVWEDHLEFITNSSPKCLGPLRPLSHLNTNDVHHHPQSSTESHGTLPPAGSFPAGQDSPLRGLDDGCDTQPGTPLLRVLWGPAGESHRIQRAGGPVLGLAPPCG